MPRTILIHYHLFKNAGTSLDHVLKANFADKWVTSEFPNRPGPNGNTPLVEDWIRDNPDAVAFSSHTMSGPVPQIEGVRVVSLMLLRDPIKRIKSAYQFERAQDSQNFGAVLARHTNFEGYVRSRLALGYDRQCKNFQTSRLAALAPGSEPEFERALVGLEDVSIFGLVSDFAGFMRDLQEEIADDYPDFVPDSVRRNVSKSGRAPELDVSDELEAILLEANRDDAALVAQVQKRIGARVTNKPTAE